MRISTRLSAGFGLLNLLFIICAGTAIQALNSARNSMDEVVNVRLKKYQTVLDMRGGVRDMAIAMRNLALMTDPVAMKPEWERLQKQRALYIRNREALSRMMQTDAGPAGCEAMSRIESTEEAALSTLMNAGKLGLENRQQEVTDYLLTVTRPAQQTLLKAINDLTELEMRNSRDAVVENGNAIARTTWILIILAAISVLAAVASCAFIVRTLMRQLGGEPVQAQTLAAAIAAGDLTSAITLRGGDSTILLASLSGMQTNLHGLVTQIKDASASVALAADEISQGNSELSSRTEQQAAALQETSASMEQLTATVKAMRRAHIRRRVQHARPPHWLMQAKQMFSACQKPCMTFR